MKPGLFTRTPRRSSRYDEDGERIRYDRHSYGDGPYETEIYEDRASPETQLQDAEDDLLRAKGKSRRALRTSVVEVSRDNNIYEAEKPDGTWDRSPYKEERWFKNKKEQAFLKLQETGAEWTKLEAELEVVKKRHQKVDSQHHRAREELARYYDTK